jgi:hypothetical protein
VSALFFPPKLSICAFSCANCVRVECHSPDKADGVLAHEIQSTEGNPISTRLAIAPAATHGFPQVPQIDGVCLCGDRVRAAPAGGGVRDSCQGSRANTLTLLGWYVLASPTIFVMRALSLSVVDAPLDFLAGEPLPPSPPPSRLASNAWPRYSLRCLHVRVRLAFWFLHAGQSLRRPTPAPCSPHLTL